MTFAADPNRFLDVHASALVGAYFAEHESAPRFSGSWFERIGREDSSPGHLTAADLVAVTTLGVKIPGHAAIQMLGLRSAEIDGLLSDIPSGVDLWDAPPSVVADGSAADRLWRLLESIDGIGWVTAGKLCARKRPRLLPIYDSVVKDALALPDGEGFWSALHRWLTNQPEAVDRLRQIRDDTPGVPPDLPLLRVLDIAIWMRNYGKKDAAGEAVQDIQSICG